MADRLDDTTGPLRLSDDVLQEAHQWACLLFGVPALALLLDLPEARLRIILQDPDDPLCRTIRKGWLKTEAELRTTILDLARNGSGPAQEQAVRLIKTMDQ